MSAPRLAVVAFVAIGTAAITGVAACAPADAADTKPSGESAATDAKRPLPPPPRRAGAYLKGQLHAHSSGSLDSDTPPEHVVRWYSERGYDFLVLTDHNRITRAEGTPSMLVLPGIELTLNLRTCDPPPANNFQHCLLHMNGLFPERPLEREPWRPAPRSMRRSDLYGAELAEGQRLGALLQLDHPNFHFAADASLLVELAGAGVGFVEIANEAHDSMNQGDATHASTEALWDAALTRGARVLGTATDDAHDYFDDPSVAARFPMAYTGDRGFVMVHADRTARSIRDALTRGDFYASTGLLLARLEMSADQVYIEADADRPVWFEIIGEGGGVHRAEAGRTLSFEPRAIPSKYIRIRATDAAGRHAWTQPLFATVL